MARNRTRQWQAEVTWPSGAVMMFGVKAKDRARAEARACALVARLPGADVTLTRLYWHKLRPDWSRFRPMSSQTPAGRRR